MPTARSRLLVLIAATAVAGGLVSCVYSPEPEEYPAPMMAAGDSAADANPPDRAGRISYVDGAVSFRPAAADTWAFAEPNRTVTTGDRLWVDSVGRAELQVGQNAVRASTETELDVVHLDDDMFQISIPQGIVSVRIRSFNDAEDDEIDVPNAAITISDVGTYRVEVMPDGETSRVTVRAGKVTVTAGGQSFPVAANQTATIQGDSQPTYDVAAAPAPDAFDGWATSRDAAQEAASQSSHFASPDMGGVSELDAAGTWAQDPDDGPVWYPSGVAVDWAPYRFGHWVWIVPWGWTWVDDAPWGWAPFHYGRWRYAGDRWGWCPGTALYRPVYAPGLVGYVGGPGWTFGVGWFPLGPREPFFPGYHTDFGYRQRINVTNYTDVSVLRAGEPPSGFGYRNRSVANAVTVVPNGAFASGAPVSRAMTRIGPEDLARATVVGHYPSVVPTSAGLAAGFGRATAVPPRALETRTMRALHAPPPRAVPFATLQHSLAETGGRPPSFAQLASLRASSGAPVGGSRFRSAASVTGRGLTPAHAGLPASHAATDGNFGRRGSASGASSLEGSYQAQRQQMESRHMQEFAQPSPRESETQMLQRQETEHRDLQTRYQAARIQGASRVPASHGFGGGGGFHQSAPRGGGGGGRPH